MWWDDDFAAIPLGGLFTLVEVDGDAEGQWLLKADIPGCAPLEVSIPARTRIEAMTSAAEFLQDALNHIMQRASLN